MDRTKQSGSAETIESLRHKIGVGEEEMKDRRERCNELKKEKERVFQAIEAHGKIAQLAECVAEIETLEREIKELECGVVDRTKQSGSAETIESLRHKIGVGEEEMKDRRGTVQRVRERKRKDRAVHQRTTHRRTTGDAGRSQFKNSSGHPWACSKDVSAKMSGFVYKTSAVGFVYKTSAVGDLACECREQCV